MASPLRSSSIADPEHPPVGEPVSTHVPGSALVPKFGEKQVDGQREVFVWCGVIPSCPVESVDVAGINFPKVTERIYPDPAQKGKSRRVPQIGTITKVDPTRLRRLADHLPRKVIHLVPEPEQRAEAAIEVAAETKGGAMKGLGDLGKRRRRGFLRTIPDDATRKQYEEQGRYRPFVHKDGDEPAARYMFMVRCEDQDNPAPGGHYPPTLEESGLDLL